MADESNPERCKRWRKVIGYEVRMLYDTVNFPSEDKARQHCVVRNMVAESMVLHTRNLCDFCTSTRSSDIKPLDLFGNFVGAPEYEELRRLLRLVGEAYGRNTEGTPKWAFNKMLAHPTKERRDNFEYGPYLNRVFPLLHRVILEIVRLEEARGRAFPPND